MALTFGINSLALLNKGGGLKRQPTSQAGYYLDGALNWTLFPTTMEPTAHEHSAGDITSGTLGVPRGGTGLDTVTANGVLYGDGTNKLKITSAGTNGQLLAANAQGVPTFTSVKYAASESIGGPASSALACTGNAATATKLAAGVNLTVGNTAKSFDGSTAISWTLAEIGAAPTTHNHDSTYLKLSGGTLTGSLSLSSSGDLTLSKHAGLNRLAYFDASGKVQSSASILTTSFSKTNHNHDNTYLKLSGGTLTGNLTLGEGACIYKSGWEGNRIPYFVSGEMVTNAQYTISSFAAASHTHSILTLYNGEPDITAGRLLISGTGGSGYPTWLPKGSDGQWLTQSSGEATWANPSFAASAISSGTLEVARGGTGKSSFTAYALILGGTSTTGALQSMTWGTARQLLASSGAGATPQWLPADEYERFTKGGTNAGAATQISAKTGISEKIVFIDRDAEGSPQNVSYFKAPAASGQNYGDRIVLYCATSKDDYKYIVVPSGTEKFCDLVGGQYSGNVEASYGNKVEMVCLPKSGAKAWYISRIALINNN